MLTCVIVPHYEHIEQFRQYLPKLLTQGYPLVVVDDASSQSVFEQLQQLLTQMAPDAILVRHAQNRGKGGAVMTGLQTASAAGFSHAIQVDADGQHDASALGCLHEVSKRHPDSLVCGEPVFDQDISRLRYYARYLTLFLVWAETLSTEIRDALCGLRIYPLEPILGLLQKVARRNRMDFDPEILVRAVWAGIPLRYVPVQVQYPVGGLSHFHYLRDNLIISWMHTRLLAGMLPRAPGLMLRKIRNRPMDGDA
jgi:glycosyltransferase involved in cell wall biosynthesis